jgi:hypothetical protein
VSTGTGVKWNDGGARSLWLGPAEQSTRGVMVVGTVGVLQYPDSYCAYLPRVGATWGGGSNNRATRHVMIVMAAVIND